MQWEKLFAERAAQLKPNTIREFLKFTRQPGVISFGGGLPAPELFPLQEIEAATSEVVAKVGPRAFQYGESEGIPELREYLAATLFGGRVKLTRENILITTGGQQALDLVGRLLLNPGDLVLVENPTYLSLLSSWRLSGAVFRGVDTDEQGLRIDQLEAELRRRFKAIYVIPNFQNPQGSTLSLERRKALVELATRHKIPVLEDDPYGPLRYSGEALRSLFELDAMQSGDSCAEHVVYAGTFSKVLAPGLRVGWVVGPVPVINKLVNLKQAADLQSSTFNQFIALTLAQNGVVERQVPRLCETYRERRDAMISALERYFPPEVTWTRPEGGLFLLVNLPERINAAELIPAAFERKVAFIPGGEFHLHGGHNTMRLNFSNASPEKIDEGISRLGELVKDAPGQESSCGSGTIAVSPQLAGPGR